MTKEERSIQWLKHIPEAEKLPPEERIQICNRAAKGTGAVFFGLLVAECILLYLVSGGAVFDALAEVINGFADGGQGTRRYRSLAVFGIILLIPFFVLPVIAAVLYRKKRLTTLVEQSGVGRKQAEPEKAEPKKEWLDRWEQIKGQLDCKTDLEAYFRQLRIGTAALAVLDIGQVHFSTGRVVACDPFIELDAALPFLQTIPAGAYPVKICVAEADSDMRYACAKVEVSDRQSVRYELAMTGTEDLEQEFAEGEFFGFGVDAGMACIVDQATQQAFNRYWQKRLEDDTSIDPYNDLFSDLLEESYKEHPEYQRDLGDWVNWRVPETDCDLPVFASGWGDGYYPVYFGYDAMNQVCGIYVHFIDIEMEFSETVATAEAQIVEAVASYRNIAELVIHSPQALAKLDGCFRSPQQYLRENAEQYEMRGIEGEIRDDKIIWLGLVDEMIAEGTAVELDWKSDQDEFLEEMQELAEKQQLELSAEWLDEDADIPVWCETLDEHWSEQGYCVAALDIDSDSYVLFICKRERLDELITLGKQVNHRFDFAKNM